MTTDLRTLATAAEQANEDAYAANRALVAAVRALPDTPPVDPPVDPPIDPPPPSGSVPTIDMPAGKLPLLRLDADIGLKPPWQDLRQVAPDRLTRVTGIPGGIAPRRGTHCYRIEVRPGDKPSSSGERSEFLTSPNPGLIAEGAIWYWAGSTLFPVGFKPSSGPHQIFMQLHGVGDSLSPAVSIRTDSRGIVLRLRGGSNDETKKDVVVTPDLAFGTWHDFLIAAIAGGTTATGRIALWHRLAGGTWKQACDLRIETTHGHAQYYRRGIYRGAMNQTDVIFHDCDVFGSSLAVVAAAAWGTSTAAGLQAAVALDDDERDAADTDDDVERDPADV